MIHSSSHSHDSSMRPWLALVVGVALASACRTTSIPPDRARVPQRASPTANVPASERGHTEPVPEVGIAFEDTTLFPETAVYDASNGRLLVGSVRHGAVYSVDADGRAHALVDDPRLCSVLGIAIDESRGRLVVLDSNLGVSDRRCGDTPKARAGAGFYDLASGEPIHYVDLAALGPQRDHLANAVAVDSHGNAYVSDSFGSSIYRVEPNGTASVWLEDKAFGGPGIGLNGLVVHPGGYLLAVQKNNGSLLRIPLGAPTKWHPVKLSRSLRGADGILLTGAGTLVVVANETTDTQANAAYLLSSTDGWQSASIEGERQVGAVYPTVPVAIGSRLFYLHTRLRDLLESGRGASELSRQARLDYLGESKSLRYDGVRAEPEAFVLAELQLVAGSPAPSWDELGAPLATRPGLLDLTWLGASTDRVSAFLSFDSTDHAHSFANGFFPRYAAQVGVGQSTKLFDARLTRAASRDMGSVHFGGRLAATPQAFVYTELQVRVPFSQVPWQERNRMIRSNPGFMAKTWLSGINTHTVGGLYAFETLADARQFALGFFPRGAARQGAAFTAMVYDATLGERSSRTLDSPFFRHQDLALDARSR